MRAGGIGGIVARRGMLVRLSWVVRAGECCGGKSGLGDGV